MQRSVTSAYIVGEGGHDDCGWRLAAGGGAFYGITFSSATGYAPGCRVAVTNTDVAACKGKSVAVNGFTYGFILYPGQTVEITRIGDAWFKTQDQGRWTPNCGGNPIVIHTDVNAGSDEIGVADGLGAGTEAFRSVGNALQFALTNFNCASIPQTRIRILMAGGTTDPDIVHFSPHVDCLGGQGGAVLLIDGNGGTLSGGLQFYYGATVQIRNVTITNAAGGGGGCLIATEGAKVQLLDQVTFGACPGNPHIQLSDGALVQIMRNISIGGSAENFIWATGSWVEHADVTISLDANVTYKSMVFARYNSLVNLGGVQWSLGGFSVTGRKYDVGSNAVLTGSADVPGTIPGTTADGGRAL